MKKLEQKRKYCSHCNEFLTLPVFKRHKDDYYDSNTRSWRTNVSTYDEARDAEDDNAIMFNLCKGHKENVVNESMVDNVFITYDSDQSYDSNQSVNSSEGEEHWDTDIDEILKDLETSDDVRPESTVVCGSVHTILLFLSLWASFYGVSATALNHIIGFLHHVFSTIVTKSFVTIGTAFPSSLYMAHKYFGLSVDKFEKYVVCVKCGSLYSYKNCCQTSGSREYSKTCNHIQYRNHPHESHRAPCGQKLLREIITQNGKKLYPIKTYCYCSLRNSLSEILGRKGFLEKCELWRTREVTPGLLSDIYDGAIWHDFMNYKGRPYLSEPHHLALMLNCDWFQPYKQTQYSIGVIYLVILNLPRDVRFKPENILLCGIIPGPKEPKQYEMNEYLRPLVKELTALWVDGFELKRGSQTFKIYAVLLATVCDIPATQKVCGFVGHTSHLCCCKCKKYFPYNEELQRVDFSGVDIGTLRNHEQQKADAKKSLNARTKTERNKVELENGCRFTELMHLPYYDCIRFTIIDPMHNLLLGAAKRILQTQWIEKGLITSKDFNIIQERIKNCILPINTGRIPRKITSAFFSLTADEWKNWTLLYSLVTLHDILPSEHLACWKLFVSACQIYCSSVISLADIEKARECMESFFRSAERLYGSQFLTLNLHLHLHLSNCYIDYGPCYSFWLFSFERYNGILGRFHTNHQSVEIQIMRKFMEYMNIRSIAGDFENVPGDNHFLFDGLLTSDSSGTSNKTLFGQNLSSVKVNTLLLTSGTSVYPTLNYIEDIPVRLLSPFVLHRFDFDAVVHLTTSYKMFLPDVNEHVPQLCKKHRCALWISERLNCSKCSSENFICIQAYWPESDGAITTECKTLWTGKLEYFFSQKLCVSGELKEVAMVKIKWFEEHPKRTCLMEPIEIWCNDFFVPLGPASFMPVMRIHHFCVACPMNIDGESVLAINPIVKKVFL